MIEHEVIFEEDRVFVLFDADEVTVDDILDTLEGIGYRPDSYTVLDS